MVDDNTGPETPTLDKGVRTQPTYPAPYDRGSEATYSSHTVPYTLVYCVYTHFLSVYSMLFIICINTLILHLYSPPPLHYTPFPSPFPLGVDLLADGEDDRLHRRVLRVQVSQLLFCSFAYLVTLC